MAERETVTVGCKMPNGLRLHVMQRVMRNGEPVEPPRFDDKGFLDLQGHGLINYRREAGAPLRTEGMTTVDKEMFDIWMAENKDGPLVKNGVVFVPKSAEQIEAERKESEQKQAAERRDQRPQSKPIDAKQDQRDGKKQD